MSDIIPQNLTQIEQAQNKKRCNKCKKFKLLDDFYDATTPKGKKIKLYSCKTCDNERKRLRRLELKKDQVKRREHLKYTYNLELEDYDRMFAEQGGVCAICKHPETTRNQYGIRSLSVDHDHRTGKVRALLCSKCNTDLGGFERNFSAFTAYLKCYE